MSNHNYKLTHFGGYTQINYYSTLLLNIDDIRSTELPAFRRTQWFETAKTVIQIFLMAVFAGAVLVFIVLLIMAGTTSKLPDLDGTRALSQLFVEVAENAKAVALFALGFFFREYLNARGINGK